MKNSESQVQVGPTNRIAKVSSLARILGTTEDNLLKISQTAEDYWIPGKNIPKSDGTLRKTNNAKKPLKDLHQAINTRILNPCKYPDYLHGSLPKRSILTNAQVHTSKAIVINEDIESFFPSISCAHVFSIWKHLFYCTDEIAQILSNLTTYKGSLPQGWKPSTFLANLVFFKDEHLLVAKLNKMGFQYSRLIDDISISTKRSYTEPQLAEAIKEIHAYLARYGFKFKRSKHTIRPRYTRQVINKQVVNSGLPTLPREKRNEIRAQVHRLELESQLGFQGSLAYQKKWRSVCQKVGLLKHAHPTKWKALKMRLRAIKPDLPPKN